MTRACSLPLVALVFALFNAGCSSDDSPVTGTGPVGGPITGSADAHCDGREPGTVDPATCKGSGAEGGASGDDEGEPSQAGANDCNATHDAEYGETLPNSEGDDDDCKYHASFTSTPIRLNEDVTFTVTATDLVAGEPLDRLSSGEAALSRVEVYQPCKPTRRPPAQDYEAALKETGPGMFSVGPLRFDEPGRWVVRFHFYEDCVDGETSPHGHIAFFVDVP